MAVHRSLRQLFLWSVRFTLHNKLGLLVVVLALALCDVAAELISAETIRWYPVPVWLGRVPIRTGIVLGVHFDSINKQLSNVSSADGPIAQAVKDIYAAIAIKDLNHIRRSVRLPPEFRSLQEYVDGFNASLQDFRTPFLEGIIQRPDRIQLVLLRGVSSHGTVFRTHRFTGSQGTYELVQSTSPTLIETLIADVVFAASTAPELFQPVAPTAELISRAVGVPEVPYDENMSLQLSFSGQEANIKISEIKPVSADQALTFYAGAYRALTLRRYGDYAAAIVPQRRAEALKAVSQSDFATLKQTLDARTIVYSIGGEHVEFVFFTDLSAGHDALPVTVRHEDVVKTSSGQLGIKPETDVDAIDNLLSDPEFQAKTLRPLIFRSSR